MLNNEKHRQYNRLEIKLKKEWLKLCSKYVDNKLPKDCGTIEVSIKGFDTYVIIFFDDTKPVLRKIEVDNKHIWNYIVNELYMDKPKIVNLSCDHKGHVPFSFDNELYNELDEIWNNEELKSLAEELFR